MNEDPAPAGSAAAGRDGDVDRRRARREEVVEGDRRCVAEERLRAAGEDGGHPAPARGKARVAGGVDAAVERMKMAARDQARDHPPAQAERDDLGRRDDAALVGSEGGEGTERPAVLIDFGTVTVRNSPTNRT